jgi:hypothetical protein
MTPQPQPDKEWQWLEELMNDDYFDVDIAKRAIQSHIQQETRSAMLRQKAYDERQLQQQHEAEVLEARLSEANEIFYLIWDEDGSPLQRDDPPREMLDRLVALDKRLAHLKQQQQERGTA